MSLGKIIRLDPSDYEKCNNIWDMKRHPDKAKLWYDQLVSSNRITFVYVENGEFIGEGSLQSDRGDPDYTIPGKRIYLSRMIVKKEFRNRGIAGMLIDHMVDYARELGYKEMSLGVNVDNLAARHLYEKKGFTEIIFHGSDEDGEYVKLIKKL
jgi:ribosomal protein S18 acetylase RimI-like enzyme